MVTICRRRWSTSDGMRQADFGTPLCRRCWPAWSAPDGRVLGHFVSYRQLELVYPLGNFVVCVLDVADGIRHRYSGQVRFPTTVGTQVKGTTNPFADMMGIAEAIAPSAISVEAFGDPSLTRSRTKWASSRPALRVVGEIVTRSSTGEYRSPTEIEKLLRWHRPRTPAEHLKQVDLQLRRVAEIVIANPTGWNQLVAEDPEVLRLGNRPPGQAGFYSLAYARALKKKAVDAGYLPKPKPRGIPGKSTSAGSSDRPK